MKIAAILVFLFMTVGLPIIGMANIILGNPWIGISCLIIWGVCTIMIIQAVADLQKQPSSVDSPIVTPEQITIIKTSADGSREIRESRSR